MRDAFLEVRDPRILGRPGAEEGFAARLARPVVDDKLAVDEELQP